METSSIYLSWVIEAHELFAVVARFPEQDDFVLQFFVRISNNQRRCICKRVFQIV